MATITEAETAAPLTSQVRVVLTSRDSDLQLPQDVGPILVSTGLKRYALSTLVNKLLDSERPVPFEFLINGQFLRTTIDDFLTANGISAETTLTVEYIRALIPPIHTSTFEHDDWVSSVDVLSGTSPAGQWSRAHNIASGQERVISGSYDGLIRVWGTSSELLCTSASFIDGGHSAAVKAVKFVSPIKVASAGNDRTIRLWDYTDDVSGPTLKPVLELYGHKSSVDSIAVHAPSSRILSASADHTVGLWSTRKGDAPAAPETLLPSNQGMHKRRRLSKPAKSNPQRGPLLLLTGHTDPATGAVFAPDDATVAYSVSRDHSLRTWDLPTGTLVDTRTTAHPLLSVFALTEIKLVAAGTSARHITMVDPRASAASVAAMTLRGHTNAVSSLAGDPASPYGLVSGGHDGTCRVWDIRSLKSGGSAAAGGDHSGGQVAEPVYTISRTSAGGEEKRKVGGEGVKVFDVKWDEAVGIVSAGEDKRVQVNRAMP